MKSFIKKFGVTTFALCCLLIISAGILVFGGDSYNLGKASVTPQLEQANNEFTLKIQQLQLDIANKQKENDELMSQITECAETVIELSMQNDYLMALLEETIAERDEAIEAGSSSQEVIDGLNAQIDELNASIAEKENDIALLNSQITTLNQSINSNSEQIEKLNLRSTRLAKIIDKTVTEVYAEDLEGITQIGDSIFYKCTKLVSVEIPEGVTSIGDNAFASCTNLKTVSFPSTLEKIGTNASDSSGSSFSGCTALTSVDLSNCKELLYLDKNTFYNCKALTSALLPEEGKLRSLYNAVFRSCSALTNITVPNTVTTMGSYCFGSCSALSTINFKASVSTISKYAFEYCTSLTEIDLSGRTALKTFEEKVFQRCTGLKTVKFPGNLTSLGSNLFSECTALENVEFEDASNITTLNGTFSGCTSLKSFNLEQFTNLTTIDNAFKSTRIMSIKIPTSVTSIGAYSFQSCKYLRVIDFTGCDKLKSFGVKSFDKCYSLLEVKNLQDCTSLTSLGSSTFNECYSLPSIVIPANVTGSISVFSGAKLYEVYNLSSLTFSYSNTKVVHTSLDEESILIEEDGLIYYPESEDNYVLVGLKDLTKTSVTINEKTKSISAFAFYGCDLLEEITILSTTPPELLTVTVSSTAINGFTECSAKLYVSGIDVYTSATTWKDLPNEFVEIVIE